MTPSEPRSSQAGRDRDFPAGPGTEERGEPMTDVRAAADLGGAPSTASGVGPSTSPAKGRSGFTARSVIWRFVPYTVLIASLATMFRDVASEIVGLSAIVMMLTLMTMKLPIALAMAVPGILGVYAIQGWPVARGMLARMPYEGTASWSLSVIPMFIGMGMLLWRSGITASLYDALNLVTRRLPGGLAAGTNLAGGGLSAVSGSTLGTTYAVARIGMPEMLRAGYDPRLAIGSVLMAGTGGQLIPPSVLLVVYAGIAQGGVGPQLLAGVVPGVLLVLVYLLGIVAIATIRPSLAGGRPQRRTREPDAAVRRATRWRSIKLLSATWPVPVLMGIVLGGMYSGALTATEAGAAGFFGALVLSLWRKRRQGAIREVKTALTQTVTSTAAIFFLLVGAFILSRLLGASGLARSTAQLVVDLEMGRVQFLLLMIVAYVLMGMFMDSLAVMLLTVPVLLPVLAALDISVLWFGVFVVLLAELGMITPPVGVLAYVVHSIVQDPDVNLGREISLKETFQGVLWLLPLTVLVLVLLILFPDFALWLPEAAN